MALSTMRNGIFSKIFLGILVLGSVGLILSDWGGFFHGGVTKTDVATIDGHQIKIAEFDHKLRRIVQSQGLTVQNAYKTGLVDQALQQNIMSSLLNKAAQSAGIVIDDKIVAKELNALLGGIGKIGDKKQALQQILQSQGLSESQLVETLRTELAVNLLKQTVTEGVYIPKAMSGRFAQLAGEKREIEFLNLSNAAGSDIKAPDDKALSNYYDTIKTEYQIPETRDVTVAILNPADLVQNAEVSDAEIRKQYDDNKADYSLQEKRVIQQSVFKDRKRSG